MAWVCGLVPLLLVAMHAARDERRIYLSRPVSASHHLFENDCSQCHRRHWRPLVRLAGIDNAIRSVRDEDCQHCHSQSSDDHHQLPDTVQWTDCAGCHAEHRGKEKLSRVADVFCVRCHGAAGLSIMKTYVGGIDSFDVHPEFSILRTSGTDDTALKFSHAGHLQPLLVPWEQEGHAIGTKRHEQLTCADCHQTDAAGQYMRPIVYEQHCARCHPLRFSGKFGAEEPLPHATTEIVHGVLRDRLMTYIRQHPEELRGAMTGPSRLPNNRPLRSSTSVKDEWDWVEQQLRTLQGDVFHNPLKNGCLKCHAAKEELSATDGIDFEIVPPNIPDRWLTHSRFRHDRHETLSCSACHHTRDQHADPLQSPDAASPLDSKSVRDVLMPSIEVCRKCHGSEPMSGALRTVQSLCVDCHQYHHESDFRPAGQSLYEIFSATGASKGQDLP